MSAAWLMTSDIVSGKYSIVPGPPISPQDRGWIVLVISLISCSSVVFDGPRVVVGLELPDDVLPEPPESIDPEGLPVVCPLNMAFGPTYGVEGTLPFWTGAGPMVTALLRMSPKFSTGMTRSATG